MPSKTLNKRKPHENRKDSRGVSSLKNRSSLNQKNHDFAVTSVSRNLLIFVIVLLMLFICLVGPIRQYTKENQRIQKLEAELKAAQDQKAYVNGEYARWGDDKYVVSYAREHFALIMPGETAMHVADPDVVGTSKDIYQDNDANQDQSISSQTQNEINKYETPWYERLSAAVK